MEKLIVQVYQRPYTDAEEGEGPHENQEEEDENRTQVNVDVFQSLFLLLLVLHHQFVEVLISAGRIFNWSRDICLLPNHPDGGELIECRMTDEKGTV